MSAATKNPNALRKIKAAIMRGWSPDCDLGPCRFIRRARRNARLANKQQSTQNGGRHAI